MHRQTGIFVWVIAWMLAFFFGTTSLLILAIVAMTPCDPAQSLVAFRVWACCVLGAVAATWAATVIKLLREIADSLEDSGRRGGSS